MKYSRILFAVDQCRFFISCFSAQDVKNVDNALNYSKMVNCWKSTAHHFNYSWFCERQFQSNRRYLE